MEQKFNIDSQCLVTIGLPVYNDEKYIRLAIQSIINQTYKNWHLIVVNDGSVDNSDSIIKEFLPDDRITYISEKNLGLETRLNQLVEWCNTPYYARMDSDDIMHPERLQRQMEVLKTHPEIDVLGTNAFTVDEHNRVIGARSNYKEKAYLKKVKSFIHPTVTGKTEWFRSNPYDVKTGRIADSELWYRTASKSNFVIITQPLFFYREVGNGYYRKYSMSGRGKKRIEEKYQHNYFWRRFFIKNTIVEFIYRVFNLFNKEQTLVNKRNKVIFNERLSYESYIE